MAISNEQFFQYIQDFFNYRQNVYEVSSQTLKTNRIDLNLFKNFMQSHNLSTVSGPAVMSFQSHLKQQRENCGASINRKIYTLRSYANFLQLYDIPGARSLPFNDVLKIRQGYRKRPNALTTSQITNLFEAIDCTTILGLRDYALYALMYQIGLRVGEVHTLNLQDIDFEKQSLTVIGKGKRPRTLHINKELVDILTQYLAVRELFYNSWLTDALFLSKKGNRLAIRTMEDNLKKILNRVQLQIPFNVTCHTLRHSLASHLNDKDVDVLVIQSILGHSSARSTEIYIHPSQKRIKEALEKLPGIIYLKELIKKGVINLTFQKRYRSKRE